MNEYVVKEIARQKNEKIIEFVKSVAGDDCDVKEFILCNKESFYCAVNHQTGLETYLFEGLPFYSRSINTDVKVTYNEDKKAYDFTASWYSSSKEECKHHNVKVAGPQEECQDCGKVVR